MAVKMTRTKIDNKDETMVIVGCIASTDYLHEMFPVLNKHIDVLSHRYSKTVVKWCLDYYKEYEKAPEKQIVDIFHSYQAKLREEVVDAIEGVLEYANSMDSGDFNAKYYVNVGKKYLKKKALENLASIISGAVSTDRLEEAEKALLNFSTVDKVESNGVDPFADSSLPEKIMSTMTDTIIQFPYPALEEAIKDIYFKDIIAVSGAAKRGKSFLMMQLGWYALLSKLNVVWFSYEMGVEILGARLFQNMLGETRKEKSDIVVPYFTDNNSIEFTTVSKQGLSLDKMVEYQDNIKHYMDVGKLRLFDNDGCGRKVSDIVNRLKMLEKYEDFVADVVIIDYDTLLENEHSFHGSSYEGTNQIWKDVKNKIALDMDTLVIFGSQLNKEGGMYDNPSPLNASGSSRKFDWASLWLSVLSNQTERTNGLSRLNVAGGRHDSFNGEDLVLTQCLAMGRPILDCKWKKDIPDYGTFVESLMSEDDKREKELKKRSSKWKV